VLALDKTGTLTQGQYQVSGRHQLASSKLPLPLVRRLAAAVEGGVAHHRLAAAVVEDGEGVEEEGEGQEQGRVMVRVCVRAWCDGM
jgi:cation transport ATPase